MKYKGLATAIGIIGLAVLGAADVAQANGLSRADSSYLRGGDFSTPTLGANGWAYSFGDRYLYEVTEDQFTVYAWMLSVPSHGNRAEVGSISSVTGISAVLELDCTKGRGRSVETFARGDRGMTRIAADTDWQALTADGQADRLCDKAQAEYVVNALVAQEQ